MEAVREKNARTKKVKEKVWDAEGDECEGDIPLLEDEFIQLIHDSRNPDSDSFLSQAQKDESGIELLPSHVVVQESVTVDDGLVSEDAKSQETTQSKTTAQLPTAPLLTDNLQDGLLQNEKIKSAEKIAEQSAVIQHKQLVNEAALDKPRVREQSPVEKVKFLYPSLAEKSRTSHVQKPLSRNEVKMYYVNPEAEALESVIDQFVESNMTVNFQRHPLYVYLNEYLKAITAYEATLSDLKQLEKAYETARDGVWQITDNKVKESSRCADNKHVTGEHFYRQCHLNMNSLSQVEAHLEKIRQTLFRSSFAHKCTAELARFQVNAYLYDAIRNSPATATIRDISPVVPRPEFVKLHETSELRLCVGILFAFHRIPIGSERFRADIRAWLTDIVGTLVRVSTFYDQLFVLSHLLRSPSPVVQWASHFLQLSLPAQFATRNCNDPFVKHFTVMLRCLLIPAKARDDYLSSFAINQPSSDQDPDSSWIMVDPDAEGRDTMRASTTMEVQESDVFSLLKQYRFDQLYNCLFGSDCLDLEPFSQINEYDVLSLFGFCYELLEILVEGLSNSMLNKYQRYNKRLAQIIRDLAIHLKEFWEKLKEAKEDDDSMVKNLQINFEELLMKGLQLLTQNGRNGTLQFLVGWPTSSLSSPNIWRAVVSLEAPSDADSSYHSDVSFWKNALTQLHSSSKLEEKLRTLDESNATYLLTALAGIVQKCNSSMRDLTEAVAMEILKISFLGPQRLTYAKTGRDLISAICVEHPTLICEVLSFVKRNMDQIGLMGYFLFQEIPLKLWNIERADLETVCEWLVNSTSIQDPTCLLAREILSNLNWGFGERNELFIKSTYQQYVAVAIVEAFLKFISTKQRRQAMYESLLRLSNMITTGKLTPEQHFVSWCWEVLLDQRLHRLTQSPDAFARVRGNSVLDEDVKSMTQDIAVMSPLQAAEQRQPLACYVAIMMTEVGHSTGGVLGHGIDWISALVENYLYVPALQVLETVTPLFFHNNQHVYLLQQDQFHYVINMLLQADATYVRTVKNILVSDFPGKTLKSFGNMLIHQLLHAGSNLSFALKLWIGIFTSLKSWNRTTEVLYLLDQIVKFSFYANELETVMSALREANEEYRQSKPARGGGMSSLVSWMTVGTAPSYVLIEGTKLAEFPWLAYMVLKLESESSAALWQSVVKHLTGQKKRTFEEGLKKASNELGVPLPSVADLPLTRTAELIVVVSHQTEVFPLLCQEFFRLFLQRSPTQMSVGDQFFLSPVGTRLQKPIKQKLKDVAELYKKKAAEKENMSSEFYQELQHAIMAFSCWIDEPKLHQANLYLPSLPSGYEPELLSTVFSSNSLPWTHFVDVQTIYSSMRIQAEHWIPFDIRLPRRHVALLSSPTRNQESPLPAPSAFSRAPSFVPVDEKYLFDPSKVLFTLRPDLTSIQEAAKSFVGRITELAALDGFFIELTTDLNTNVDKETTVFASCHKGQCAGPAEVKLKFKEFARNEPVHRAYLQNREDWGRLVTAAKNLELKPVVMSVVRFERAISTLIDAFRKKPDQKLAEVGAILFYHMLLFIGDETEEHLLAKKLFQSCVDVLGQYFIANQQSQCGPLLETFLNNQRALPMLIPHFTPHSIPLQFLPMYRRVQQALQGQNNEALTQILSTFNVEIWLNDPQIDAAVRAELLSHVAQGIAQLGSVLSFRDHPLFETYAFHLRSILAFRFPLHASDVLRILLDLSGKNLLPASGWFSCFLVVLGVTSNINEGGSSLDSLKKYTVMIGEVLQSGRLSLDFAYGITTELVRFFTEFRFANKTAKTFGLLAVFKAYVEGLAVLFMTLSSVVLKEERSLANVFTHAVTLWMPWVDTIVIEDKQRSPFLQADIPDAIILIASLRLMFDAFTEKNAKVLNQVWSWYYSSFAAPINGSIKSIESHVLAAISSELGKLSWEKFLPDLLFGESLLAVTKNGPHEARLLGATVVGKVQWGTALTVMKNMQFCGSLIEIFLFYCSDVSFRPFATEVKSLLVSTKDFDWNFIDARTVNEAVSSLSREPEALATWIEGDIEEAPIVSLLKLVLSFSENNLEANQSTAEKRGLFLRIFGRAAIAYHTKKDANKVVPFAQILTKQIEDVWFSADPSLRYNGYVSSACELFSLSNYMVDAKVENSFRSGLLLWIAVNPSSPLLIPMITAACRCVGNIADMVTYTETIIVFSFRAAGRTEWGPVINALEAPELAHHEFVKECLNKQSFLTLSAHFGRKIKPLTNPGAELQFGGDQSEVERNGFGGGQGAYPKLPELKLDKNVSGRGLALLKEIVDWCQVRPTPENETRVFPLWSQVLLLAEFLEKASEEGSKATMRQFVEGVLGMAEEKGGMFSAIGVGKQAALSRPFKVVARSLAAVAAPLAPSMRTSGKSATLTVDARNVYDAMKTKKDYQVYAENWPVVDQYIALQGSLTWRDIRNLLLDLLKNLFKQSNFLTEIIATAM